MCPGSLADGETVVDGDADGVVVDAELDAATVTEWQTAPRNLTLARAALALADATDAGALHDFRAEFERLEPLANGALDDPVSPSELRLRLDDGIGEATSATITVRWSVQSDYNVHYSDDVGRNLRWDVYAHEYTEPDGDAHYHPPPNVSGDVDASCISVRELVLVARAVHQLWRAGYDNGTAGPVNDAVDPP